MKKSVTIFALQRFGTCCQRQPERVIQQTLSNCPQHSRQHCWLGEHPGYAHSKRGVTLISMLAAGLMMTGQCFAGEKRSGAKPDLNIPPNLIQPLPGVTSINPTAGSGDTYVTIQGDFLLFADKVTFGNTTAGFWWNNDGSITAPAPLGGLGTVPVTVWSNGETAGTSAVFSYQSGYAQVAGPSTYCIGSLDQPYQPPTSISINSSNQQFPISKPMFHLGVEFDANNLPPAFDCTLAGNQAVFVANVEMCDISQGPPANGGGCTNWDGNPGQWIDPLGGSPGNGLNGADFSATLNSPGSADLPLDLSSLFDQQNLVRTLRIDLAVILADTQYCPDGCWASIQTSSQFNVAVTPAAMLQLKVIPYTILYQPPGNQSTASFGTTSTFTTQFSVGNSSDISNKTTVSQSSKQSSNFSIGATIEDALTLGYNGNASDSWDQSASNQVSTEINRGDSNQMMASFQNTWTIGPVPTLIPGNGQTCASQNDCSKTQPDPNYTDPLTGGEPFWHDTFILQVHPQFATFVVGNGQDQTAYYAAAPAIANFTVAELDACARGVLLYGQDQCQVQYGETSPLLDPNGQQIAYNGDVQLLTLSPADAANLLKLDPFYVGGQNPWLPSNRATLVPFGNGIEYGGKIGQSPVKYANTFSNTDVTSSNSGSQTGFDTSLTNSLGTDQSNGFTVGVKSPDLNESVSLTIESGDTYSTDTETKLTYTDSTAKSQQLTTQAQVTLDDSDNNQQSCPKCHNPLPNTPTTSIFVDRLFGSFMFQDPGAPKQILAIGPSSLGQELYLVAAAREQAKSRFSDVGLEDPSELAIGLLVRTQLMSGYPDGNFHPGDGLTAGDLATALVKPLHLATSSPEAGSSTAPAPDPAAAALAAVVNAGLLETTPGAALNVNDVISRQSIAVALARSFNLKTTTRARLTDGSDVAPWAAESVAAVIAAGYMSVDSDGSFHPTAPVTRAEAAVALNGSLRDQISAAAKMEIASGADRSLLIVSGDGQTGQAGSLLANPLVVQVNDGKGNPLADFPLTFSVVAGNGSISATQVVTDSTGRASTEFMLGSTGDNAVGVTSPIFSGQSLTFVTQATGSSTPGTTPF